MIGLVPALPGAKAYGYFLLARKYTVGRFILGESQLHRVCPVRLVTVTSICYWFESCPRELCLGAVRVVAQWESAR